MLFRTSFLSLALLAAPLTLRAEPQIDAEAALRLGITLAENWPEDVAELGLLLSADFEGWEAVGDPSQFWGESNLTAPEDPLRQAIMFRPIGRPDGFISCFRLGRASIDFALELTDGKIIETGMHDPNPSQHLLEPLYDMNEIMILRSDIQKDAIAAQNCMFYLPMTQGDTPQAFLATHFQDIDDIQKKVGAYSFRASNPILTERSGPNVPNARLLNVYGDLSVKQDSTSKLFMFQMFSILLNTPAS